MVKITCPVCGGSGRVPSKSKDTTCVDEQCKGCYGIGIQIISDEAYVRGMR